MSLLALQTKSTETMIEEMNSHLSRANNAIEKTLIYNYWSEAVKDELDDLTQKQVNLRKMRKHLQEVVDAHQTENASIFSGLIGVEDSGRVVNGRTPSYSVDATGKVLVMLYFDYDTSIERKAIPTGSKLVIRDAFSPYYGEVNYVYETENVATSDNFKIKVYVENVEKAQELQARIVDGTLVGEKILISTI